MSLTLGEVRNCGNRLLNKLTNEQLQVLLPRLEKVHHKIRDVIHERHQPIRYVHFPGNAILSNLLYMEGGTAVEVGTVGNEGISSVELLARASVAIETCVCQVAGDGLRMQTNDFREAISGATPLHHLTECYLQTYLVQLSQSVACNRMHTIEERFARWLLLTHDRVGSDEFFLTQEFIASMLGVHRPSVSLVAGTFQSAGMIKYSRGRITILNRAPLEDTSCECYAAVKAEFLRVLNIPYG